MSGASGDILRKARLGFGAPMPVVLQSEAAECGLACLAMVAAHYGNHSTLADLRRKHGVSMAGITLHDLMAIADRMGLAGRALSLELDELPQLQLPCVVHWDFRHFVVLREVGRGGVVLHDPAIGERRLSLKEFAEHFTGVALELAPTADFRVRARAPELRLGQLFGRFVHLRSALARVFALALALEIIAICTPFYLQWVVDEVLITVDRTLLTTLALGFGLLVVFQSALTVFRSWVLMSISASIKLQGKGNLFTHLQKLPVAFFEARQLGDIVSRFGSVDHIQRAITTELVEAVLDGVLAVGTLLVMFLFSPLLASLVLAGFLLYAGLRAALYAPMRAGMTEEIVWSAREQGHFIETVRAVKTIKLMSGLDKRRSQWLNLLVEAVNRELTVERLRIVQRAANVAITGLLNVLVIWLGARMVLESSFTAGMLIAFVSYKTQFLSRGVGLADKYMDLRMLRLHADRLADVVLAEPEKVDGGRPDKRITPSVELRDLRFRYSDHDPWVLDGVSFRIAEGESVAVVGPSGCGKTTLLKVLSSLLEPSAGEIFIGGEPLRHIGLANYRRQLGVVMQEDQLISGTIADNISFFSHRPSRRRIEECARLASIHDDIAAMPMGYESLIGDMGTSLSGGQKQRVLLARALYRRPRILLLDEATSHLDVQHERAVNRAIAGLGITRIIIAHRPETIRSADRIIMLGAGKVVRDIRAATRTPGAG